MRAQWTCPYCGAANFTGEGPQSILPFLAYCDLDEGGCDQPCVVEVKVQVTTTCRRIEGYQGTSSRGAR